MIKTALKTFIYDSAINLLFDGAMNNFKPDIVNIADVKVGDIYSSITFLSQNGSGETIVCYNCLIKQLTRRCPWSNKKIQKLVFSYQSSNESSPSDPSDGSKNAYVTKSDIIQIKR